MVREDLMISSSGKGLGFTEFLALILEDTHWYKVNK